MPSFYRQHKKIISVLMVAVFAAGGIFFYKSAKAADDTAIQLTPEQLRELNDGSININSSGVTSDSGSESVIGNATSWFGVNNVVRTNTRANTNVIGKVTEAEVKGNSSPSTLESILGSMIAWFLYYIAVGLGWIMMLITKVMLTIGVFNSFLSQPAVKVGWTITRDICNNFFIIFMMILAAGVTLHLPSYTWRTMLPKILIFAVLINFSMIFTGILIDVSQVIMLTFASPLATTQGYNIIISAFGLPSSTMMSQTLGSWVNGSSSSANGAINVQDGGIQYLDIVAALLFAIIVTIVAVVVIVCITVILVYRIIMLMFLVVLSPLYFLSKASNVSALGSMGSQWMSQLFSMLTVGPAMFFFLYLSFMTMATVNNYTGLASTTAGIATTASGLLLNDPNLKSQVDASASAKDVGATINKGAGNSAQYVALSNMASVTGVLNFLVVVGLLWASLMMGRKFGDAAGGVAGKGMGWLSSAAKKYSGFNLAKSGAAQLQKAPGAIIKGAGAKIGTGALGVTSATTRVLGRATGSVGLQKLGEVGGQWRQDVLGARRKARIAKLSKFMGKMGLGSDEVKEKWGEFTDTDLAKKSKAIALGAGSVLATGGMALATGGAGLLPGLAVAAAGYVGGGGRLMEMALGQRGIARAKKREEEQKKINQVKQTTDQLVADSEIVRDQDNIKDEKSYFSNRNNQKAKDAFESAQRRMAGIENAKLTDTNRKNGKGLDPEIHKALAKNGWSSGAEITDKMLETAISGIKAGTAGTAGFWAGQQKNITDFAPHQARIDHTKDVRETEHKKRVMDKLNDNYTKATNPEEKRLLDAERKRFETEYDAKVTLEADTSRVKADLQREISRINASAKPEMEKIEERRQYQQIYNDKISDLNKSHADTIAAAQHQAPKPRAIDSFLEDYKPYAHENWMSQGVAKDAQKMKQAIKDLVSSMESAGSDLLEGFNQLSRGSFYSNSGQTETQFKSIKAMADSTKTVHNLIDALSAMPKDLSGQQAQLVKELKQGIAAFKKGGGDTSKLTAVITLLDQKNGKNKEGKLIDDKSVSEYENEIKPKK